MPDTALTTRVTEETYRRLHLQAAFHRCTIQRLVDVALSRYLADLEELQHKMQETTHAGD